MFKIKEFQEKDAVTLTQIFTEAFSDEITRGMPTFTPERFIDFAKRPGTKIYVAEDARNAIIGFLTLTEGSPEFSPQVQLVAVKKAKRGRGVGKELIRKAIEHARATGRKKLKLFTRPWNTAMSKVCLDLGFVPEAYLRRDYLDADLVLYSAFLQ